MSSAPLYSGDLALIQAEGFGDLAAHASPGIVTRLKAAPVKVRRVYDIGCGAGVTTWALLDAGFETIAVEPSAALLAIARSAAPSATFVEASAYDVALKPCEAVLAVGEVLTYHAPDANPDALVRGFFRKVADALPSGGLLIFDVIDASGPPLDSRGWKSTDKWTIVYESQEDPDNQRLIRHLETFVREGDGRYRHAEEEHTVTLFDKADIQTWLAQAGFDVEVARAYGRYQLAPRHLAFFATRR